MQLTLYVPGLLLPQAVLENTVFDLAAPALSLLLGRGQRSMTEPDWLARAFAQHDPLPVAALRKVGTGGTADGNWICFDPVHWHVTREGITLTEATLDDSEATALIDAVQPLCAEWGALSASSSNQWELQLSDSLLLDTRPLTDCLGQPVDPRLPGGHDGPAWRRLLADVQTALHAHPVNRQREALGQPAINSLWPWGQGSLPEKVETDFTVVWSRDPVLAGLSSLAGIPVVMPPTAFQPATGNVLCHIDLLTRPAHRLDALAWREALLVLERDWVAPAIAALQRNDCRTLRIVGTSVNDTRRATTFSLERVSMWRFWRRPAPLTELA